MGLSLMDFAVAVKIPWQTVQAYETDRAVPPADRLLRIVHATRRAPKPLRIVHLAREVWNEQAAA